MKLAVATPGESLTSCRLKVANDCNSEIRVDAVENATANGKYTGAPLKVASNHRGTFVQFHVFRGKRLRVRTRMNLGIAPITCRRRRRTSYYLYVKGFAASVSCAHTRNSRHTRRRILRSRGIIMEFRRARTTSELCNFVRTYYAYTPRARSPVRAFSFTTNEQALRRRYLNVRHLGRRNTAASELGVRNARVYAAATVGRTASGISDFLARSQR